MITPLERRLRIAATVIVSIAGLVGLAFLATYYYLKPTLPDVAVLRDLPQDKAVHAGVIDVRNLEVEQPEQVAARIRALLDVVSAERVTLTTDCGMKQLPRPVAKQKLKSLAAGAALVRRELAG